MPRTYKPKRASKRWLEGAPDFVLDCFDHPQYADRWTVLYRGEGNEIRDERGNVTHIFGMSHGYHCGGSVEFKAHEQAAYRYRNGHRRIRWIDIPEDMRKQFENWGRASE